MRLRYPETWEAEVGKVWREQYWHSALLNSAPLTSHRAQALKMVHLWSWEAQPQLPLGSGFREPQSTATMAFILAIFPIWHSHGAESSLQLLSVLALGFRGPQRQSSRDTRDANSMSWAALTLLLQCCTSGCSEKDIGERDHLSRVGADPATGQGEGCLQFLQLRLSKNTNMHLFIIFKADNTATNVYERCRQKK